MARKKYNHKPKTQYSQQIKQQRVSTDSPLQKWFVGLLIVSVLLNVFFLVQSITRTGLLEKMEVASSKATYIVSNPMILRDTEDTSFKVSVSELWDRRMQRALGYSAQFPIPNFPDGTIIFDAQMTVYSIGLMKPFTIKGAKAYTDGYLHHFIGTTIDSVAGNNGIFKPDEEELNKFAENFKESFLRTFKMVYKYAKGTDEFEQLFPNGISLASEGDTLQHFFATDIHGKKWTINDLYGKKTAIVYVDVGCGTCKSKCGTVRDLIEPYGVQVLFITDTTEEESQKFIDDYARNQPVVCDANHEVSNLLYLGEAPYLMLIDTDLTIRYKEPINSIVDQVEPAIEEFVN